jgi:peptidoglycan/LPS O-acetylase OafA/YrhL
MGAPPLLLRLYYRMGGRLSERFRPWIRTDVTARRFGWRMFAVRIPVLWLAIALLAAAVRPISSRVIPPDGVIVGWLITLFVTAALCFDEGGAVIRSRTLRRNGLPPTTQQPPAGSNPTGS